MVASLLGFVSTPDGPAPEAAYFNNDHGLNLYVGRRAPPNGVAPESVVIWVHGLDDHGARWDHVASAMAEAPDLKAVCYLPDLQGHGRSMGAPSNFSKNVRGLVISMESIVDDIGVIMRHAVQAHPSLPLFLCGHSMGGLLCMKLVIQRPDLKALITGGIALSAPAVSPHPRDDTWLGLQILVPLAKRLGSVWPTMPSPVPLATELTTDPEFDAADHKDPLRGLHPRARTIVGIVLEMIRFKEPGVLESFDVPWLLLGSPDDLLINGEGWDEVLRRSQTPPHLKELRLFPGLRHELLREAPHKRAEVMRVLLDWLASRKRTPSVSTLRSRL